MGITDGDTNLCLGRCSCCEELSYAVRDRDTYRRRWMAREEEIQRLRLRNASLEEKVALALKELQDDPWE